MKTLLTSVGSLLVGALLACACYDMQKVPPCAPGAEYPDPCAALARDAGVDG